MPKEKTWVTGIEHDETGREKLLYTITANRDRTQYYLTSESSGKPTSYIVNIKVLDK